MATFVPPALFSVAQEGFLKTPFPPAFVGFELSRVRIQAIQTLSRGPPNSFTTSSLSSILFTSSLFRLARLNPSCPGGFPCRYFNAGNQVRALPFFKLPPPIRFERKRAITIYSFCLLGHLSLHPLFATAFFTERPVWSLMFTDFIDDDSSERFLLGSSVFFPG